MSSRSHPVAETWITCCKEAGRSKLSCWTWWRGHLVFLKARKVFTDDSKKNLVTPRSTSNVVTWRRNIVKTFQRLKYLFKILKRAQPGFEPGTFFFFFFFFFKFSIGKAAVAIVFASILHWLQNLQTIKSSVRPSTVGVDWSSWWANRADPAWAMALPGARLPPTCARLPTPDEHNSFGPSLQK